jgi:hypothetical protein
VVGCEEGWGNEVKSLFLGYGRWVDGMLMFYGIVLLEVDVFGWVY